MYVPKHESLQAQLNNNVKSELIWRNMLNDTNRMYNNGYNYDAIKQPLFWQGFPQDLVLQGFAACISGVERWPCVIRTGLFQTCATSSPRCWRRFEGRNMWPSFAPNVENFFTGLTLCRGELSCEWKKQNYLPLKLKNEFLKDFLQSSIKAETQKLENRPDSGKRSHMMHLTATSLFIN